MRHAVAAVAIDRAGAMSLIAMIFSIGRTLMPGLDGKRAIVTGAARGIGRATADHLTSLGCRVAICDMDATALADIGGLTGFQCDISDPTATTAFMAQAVEALGGLDILVNNAGNSGPTGLLEDLSQADWEQTIGVNLYGTVTCCKAALPILKAQGSGVIVNLSSTAGLYGYPLRTPYASAKWALIGLAKSLASEAGPHGVRVNAIAPGTIDGERMDGVIAREATARGVSEAEVRDRYIQQSGMRTLIDAQDIADTIGFLCSDAAKRMNGQVLSVDGHTEVL
jgi:NAD(P)-dependent dehydrogenase (short-subunit alcohol dehydrogenase family)